MIKINKKRNKEINLKNKNSINNFIHRLYKRNV